jgi:hypothetical protein
MDFLAIHCYSNLASHVSWRVVCKLLWACSLQMIFANILFLFRTHVPAASSKMAC